MYTAHMESLIASKEWDILSLTWYKTKVKYQLIMEIWLEYEDNSNIRLIRNKIIRRSTLIRFGNKPVWLYIWILLSKQVYSQNCL